MSTIEVDRIELLFLHNGLRVPFSSGTARRAPGQGGGFSARREPPLGEVCIADDAKEDSIVPLLTDESTLLLTLASRSGEEVSFFNLCRCDGKDALKLWERNCMGKGDESDVGGLVFIGGVIGRS